MSFLKSNQTLGILLIIQSLLIFVPMYILGSAIDWPASLDLPSNQILPLIYSKAAEVKLGYFIYFVYSILFLFSGSLLASHLDTNNSKSLKIASISAGLSALARAIGILRWLVPFPALAASYVTATNPNTKQTLSTVFEVVNSFGGAIGETLGVTIFASIWLGIVSWQFICRKDLPSWLGYFGFLALVSTMLIVLQIFGVDVPISPSLTLFHLWLLATGVYFLRKKN
jgi:Domain of unknown function (DUF4386)